MLRYVQIQTTSRCNADCVFCPYVESWHAENPGLMSKALWTKILADLAPYEATLNKGMIAPYLMNEPLLDPHIGDRVTSIYEAFPKTMVQLATNGSALTQRRTDDLLARLDGKKHQIWISFHATQPDHLTEIMRLEFHRTLRNILYLLKQADGGFRVLIRGAGSPRDGDHTWFTPNAYRDFWAAEFRTHGINTRKVHVDAFSFHDRAGSIRRTDRNANSLNKGAIRLIDPDHPFDCSRVHEWLHVLWDGRLRLCCMDYHGELQLPSLQEISVADYLNSPTYTSARAAVRGDRPTPRDFICKRCTSPGG